MAIPQPVILEPDQGVGELIQRVTADLKTIAKDEIELARNEIQKSSKDAAIDAAIASVGGFVALIGLALLCMVVVVVLEPAIPPLWLRLLIMAGVYLGIGSVVAALFAKRMRREVVPETGVVGLHAARTVDSIKQGLKTQRPEGPER